MDTTSSIKADGDDARGLFLKAVPAAEMSADETAGDVSISIDGSKEFVEVKVCGAKGAGPFTVNQIRPVKYIPCVVRDHQASKWYVMPATAVVKEACSRDRGQHTENPFECMAWGFNAFKRKTSGPLDDDGLRAAVEVAIREGKPHERIRSAMKDVNAECAILAAAHREKLKELIAKELHQPVADPLTVNQVRPDRP